MKYNKVNIARLAEVDIAPYSVPATDENMQNVERLFARGIAAQPAVSRRRPARRIILIAAIIAALAVTTALATNKYLVGFSPESLDKPTGYIYLRRVVNRANNGPYLHETLGVPVGFWVDSYEVEFSDYDEIGDLFTIRIGNELMNNLAPKRYNEPQPGGGWMSVDLDEPQKSYLYVDNSGRYGFIYTEFVLDNMRFWGNISIPDPDSGIYDDVINYMKDRRYTHDKLAIETTYRNSLNGIEADICIYDLETQFNDFYMDIYFTYDHIHYVFSASEIEYDPDLTAEVMLDIAKKYIDAFE